MSDEQKGVTRRGFLGGSIAAAVGGLSSGLFTRKAWAAANVTPSCATALEDLVPKGALDESYWWKVRGQFNVLDGMAFMNNGTLGPTPRMVLDVNERVAREVAEDPRNGYRFLDREVVRGEIAEFVGGSIDEIAITRNTTEGMNIFAMGIDWNEGDEVLMASHEHPWGKDPYFHLEKRRGIKINWIDQPTPPESIDQLMSLYEKAITPKTRVIMVSHAMYVTGLITPVKELTDLAHRKGLLISVDGAHPVGMLDVNIRDIGCDHYAAAGQKWLLCGTGTGICFVKEDVQEQIWELMGYTDPNDDSDWAFLRKGARKYDFGGQRNAPSALGISAAIDLQETIGKRNIESRLREMSTRFREELQEIPGVKLHTSNDPRLSAALTTFSVRDVPNKNVVDGVFDLARIYIRTIDYDLNAVRASIHFYNMPEEVDRLLGAIRHISKNYEKYMSATT